MVGGIREYIGGYFATLKDQVERAGFTPDENLAKCLALVTRIPRYSLSWGS